MSSGAQKAARPVFSQPQPRYDQADEAAFRREVERFMEATSESVVAPESLPLHAPEHILGGGDPLVAIDASQITAGTFGGTGSYTFPTNIIQQVNTPRFIQTNNLESPGSKAWEFRISGSELRGAILQDNFDLIANWLEVNRSGTTIRACMVRNTGLIAGNALGQSLLDTLGDGRLGMAHGTSPQLFWAVSTAPVNNRIWSVFANTSGVLDFRVLNDAKTGAASWLLVTRSGTAITQALFPNGVVIVQTDPGGNEEFRVGGSVRIGAAAPVLVLKEDDAPTNEKRWDTLLSGGQLVMRVADEAETSFTTWLTVDRTGITIDAINFPVGNVVITGALTLNGGGTFAGTFAGTPTFSGGPVTFSAPGITGAVRLDSTDPVLIFNESNAGVDEKRWDIEANGTEFVWRVTNDAATLVTNILIVQRTGIVVNDVRFPTSNGTFIIGDGVPINPDLFTLALASVIPRIEFHESAVAVDNRVWEIVVDGEVFRLRARSDAGVAISWCEVQRTGTTIDSVEFPGTAVIFGADPGGIKSVRINADVLIKTELELDGDLNHDGSNIGFFAVAPVARAAAYTQTFSTADKTHAAITAATLTDNTGGSKDNAVAAITVVGGSGATTAQEGVINDNFAEVVEEINALRVDLDDVKQLANAIIDDLQAYGLLQ